MLPTVIFPVSDVSDVGPHHPDFGNYRKVHLFRTIGYSEDVFSDLRMTCAIPFHSIFQKKQI